MIDESEILGLNVVAIRSVRPLRLVDLRGDGLVRMRIPTDAARASAQALGRNCSPRSYRHPDRPDGIVFHSRLNGSLNVAVYGRAVRALRPVKVFSLATAVGLSDILGDFDVAIRRGP